MGSLLIKSGGDSRHQQWRCDATIASEQEKKMENNKKEVDSD